MARHAMEFVGTLRAKGLLNHRVLYHVMKSAAPSALALIGLQFVVLSLIANRRTASGEADAGAAFATPTIVHFGTVLALSGILSAPWEGILPAAVLWGFVGLCGIAYVLDEAGDFAKLCNMAMVELEPVLSEELIAENAYHQQGDLEAHQMDDDYVRALGHGEAPVLVAVQLAVLFHERLHFEAAGVPDPSRRYLAPAHHDHVRPDLKRAGELVPRKLQMCRRSQYAHDESGHLEQYPVTAVYVLSRNNPLGH